MFQSIHTMYSLLTNVVAHVISGSLLYNLSSYGSITFMSSSKLFKRFLCNKLPCVTVIHWSNGNMSNTWLLNNTNQRNDITGIYHESWWVALIHSSEISKNKTFWNCRTKVHAQRKFAQGSLSFASLKDKVPDVKATGRPSTISDIVSEILPDVCPKTEDFLTFLCFRGTRLAPLSDFFGIQKVGEPIGKPEEQKTNDKKREDKKSESDNRSHIFSIQA